MPICIGKGTSGQKYTLWLGFLKVSRDSCDHQEAEEGISGNESKVCAHVWSRELGWVHYGTKRGFSP